MILTNVKIFFKMHRMLLRVGLGYTVGIQKINNAKAKGKRRKKC